MINRWYILMSLTLIACTSNPFFEDEIISNQNLKITGRVFLDKDDDKSDIYVWIQGLNYFTYTDINGNYSFELPPKELQPGGGLNGIFKIFYYLNNYGIDSSSILIINGEFKSGEGSIKEDGRVENVLLKKLIIIESSVSPITISNSSKDTLEFNIYLSPCIDTVIVATYQEFWGQTNSIIIVSEKDTIMIKSPTSLLYNQILEGDLEWTLLYVFPPRFFNPGTYKIVPFILIEQRGIPDDLIKSIDPSLNEFSKGYLKTPTKQSYGELTVSPNIPI